MWLYFSNMPRILPCLTTHTATTVVQIIFLSSQHYCNIFLTDFHASTMPPYVKPFFFQFRYNLHSIQFIPLNYTINCFLTYSQSSANINTIQFQNIFITIVRNSNPLQVNAPTSPTPTPAITHLLSVFIIFPTLLISSECIHIFAFCV